MTDVEAASAAALWPDELPSSEAVYAVYPTDPALRLAGGRRPVGYVTGAERDAIRAVAAVAAIITVDDDPWTGDRP